MNAEQMQAILNDGGYICHGEPGCAVHYDPEREQFWVSQAHGMDYDLTETDFCRCREMSRDELDEAFADCNPRTRTAYY